jgi:DNA-binding NtrC family response regulator
MATIVVIDSEDTVRTVVATILARHGHTVRAFGDLEEALAVIRKSEPQLVLTNVFLRGITGHDAMLKLRGEFPELPVLMVSGLPDDDVIREWTGEPKFDVFPKPFTASSLLSKVSSLLA